MRAIPAAIQRLAWTNLWTTRAFLADKPEWVGPGENVDRAACGNSKIINVGMVLPPRCPLSVSVSVGEYRLNQA
jgi:hypothetical protein